MVNCSERYKIEQRQGIRFVKKYLYRVLQIGMVSSMARKIEFDYDAAIDRATHLFWKKGYSNTSLRDLLKVMGIGEGSFYNSVGSKKQLYLECLKRYTATVSHRRLAALDTGATVREGIRAFFKTVLDELDDPKTPRICLMSGSLSSDVLAERDLRKYVIDEMGAFAARFVRRLEAAKRSGDVSAKLDPVVTASLLVTYLQGLFRVVRELQNRKELERQIEALLAGLDL